MITIKHISGPLTGQEQSFGDEQERIVIGRDPELCQVVFPPEFTVVGREHMALLRKLSGDYALDLFGDHYTEVNGNAGEPEEAIPNGAKFVLGRHGGPSFVVAVDRSSTSKSLPRTQPQARSVPLRAAATRARRYAVIGLAVALVGVVGLGLAVRIEMRKQHGDQRRAAFAASQTAFLAYQVDAVNGAQKQAAGNLISGEQRERLNRAVFAVVLKDSNGRERLLGTAWPVRPTLLATNAHVAKDMEKLDKGDTLLVRPPGGGAEEYPVVSTVVHPGFDALQKFERSDPFYVPTFGKAGITLLGIGVPGYDVALLRIETELKPDVILPLASTAEIEAMAPGDPVATSGYPYENVMGQEVQPLGRTPEIQIGNVTALTDFFFLPTDPAHSRLVHHNMPTAGGASGSPIIDRFGKVVAVHNAGNLYSTATGDRLSRIQINYAQRADMVADLVADQAAARTKADEAYWAAQTSGFKRGFDAVIPVLLRDDRPQGATGEPATSFESKEALNSTEGLPQTNAKAPKMRGKTFHFSLKAGSRHLFIVYAQDMAPVGLALQIKDGRVIAGSSDVKSNNLWYQRITFAPAGNVDVDVLISSLDQDTSYTFRDYEWTNAVN
ncbi:Trypsin-like peptidase domain-containing protein [Rhizobiales bacterium GAS191]|nr:Trypsin-like peptidase domain-containing protein [Rhizobiales bacterium GAS113]SEC25996.1 Trypsin-like peptidase domain-containing protein [Rhizobiales bacterium GAS188]SEC99269.1 Trypsin-like peptidase domain-containing protein [Rhizobiales bacterium GAS191]